MIMVVDPPLAVGQRAEGYPELERLISRAVSETQFAHELLTAPAATLNTYRLPLSHTEHQMVLAVQGARSLREFAALLYEQIQGADRPSSY